jgi:hypothetical protein
MSHTKPTPAQQTILDSEARFKMVLAGRKFGKTVACLQHILKHARSGKGKNIVWMVTDDRSARHIFKMLAESIKETYEREQPYIIRESERKVLFPFRGTVITIRVRHVGEPVDFVAVENLELLPPQTWDERISPYLKDRDGAALITANATQSGPPWVMDLFSNEYDPELIGWRSWHFTTHDNPHIDPRALVLAEENLPEHRYQSDIMANPVMPRDAEYVFRLPPSPRIAVDEKPVEGHRYVMGVDWGREHDSTAIVVIDATLNWVVAVEVMYAVGWHTQRVRVKAMAAHWSPDVIWAEANSMGSVNIESLQRDGLPVRAFQMTHRSKAPLIESLALAIERGDLSLPDVRALIKDLASYRRDFSTGHYRSDPGGSDDTVIALALAWYGVKLGGAQVNFA